MPDTDPAWRFDKASQIILTACTALLDLKNIPGDQGDELRKNLRVHLYNVLVNATKLFSEAIAEWAQETTVDQLWSEDIPKYFLDHPEKCEETLKLMADKDYREWPLE